jgi:hypothetical protein
MHQHTWTLEGTAWDVLDTLLLATAVELKEAGGLGGWYVMNSLRGTLLWSNIRASGGERDRSATLDLKHACMHAACCSIGGARIGRGNRGCS